MSVYSVLNDKLLMKKSFMPINNGSTLIIKLLCNSSLLTHKNDFR